MCICDYAIFCDPWFVHCWKINLPLLHVLLITTTCMILRHWGQNKIVAILQMTFLKEIFITDYAHILIRFSQKFVPCSPIENKSALVQIIAVTAKVTGPQSVADKTHVIPVNLPYIIIFKIRKIKPNLSSLWQKAKSFLGDCYCLVPSVKKPLLEPILLNPLCAKLCRGNINK